MQAAAEIHARDLCAWARILTRQRHNSKNNKSNNRGAGVATVLAAKAAFSQKQQLERQRQRVGNFIGIRIFYVHCRWQWQCRLDTGQFNQDIILCVT